MAIFMACLPGLAAIEEGDPVLENELVRLQFAPPGADA